MKQRTADIFKTFVKLNYRRQFHSKSSKVGVGERNTVELGRRILNGFNETAGRRHLPDVSELIETNPIGCTQLKWIRHSAGFAKK